MNLEPGSRTPPTPGGIATIIATIRAQNSTNPHQNWWLWIFNALINNTYLVEPGGIEPPTFALRTRRSPI